MSKLVMDDKGDFREDYVGRWYEGQCSPQGLYIEIDPEGDTVIEYNPEIGNARPKKVWSGEVLRIHFPNSLSLLSESECEEILEDRKELIEKIANSYTSERLGNGDYQGIWDESLVSLLADSLYKISSFSLIWCDEEGVPV